jgi:hypothetical protein
MRARWPCDHPRVRIVASLRAVELIEERGGRLYVWLKRARCCGSLTTLEAASSPPRGTEFRQVENAANFELYLPAHVSRLPDELHVEVRRRSQRIEAYWNGCAWVT